MKQIRIYTVCGGCMAIGLLCCPACTKEEADNGFLEGELAEVKVHTRATGEDVAAELTFWDDENFHEGIMKEGAGLTPVPYGSIGMERNIDYYRYGEGETFSTGFNYRVWENNYLHATGYAPGGALYPASLSSPLILWVREDAQNGKTDFLGCDGNVKHRGSLADPFTKPEHELEFRHLLSRIRFVGKRDEVMRGVISVNNVTITLRQTSEEENSSSYNQWAIPTKFQMHSFDYDKPEEDKCTYLVSASIFPEKGIVLSQDDQNYIPVDEPLTLTSCYVHQEYPVWYKEDPFVDLEKKDKEEGIMDGTITLLLDIEADFSWYNGGSPVFYERYRWEKQSVSIKSTYGNTMLPGVEYVVNITFKHEGLTLQGEQQAWKDGGIHYLPVVPESKTENE